MKRQASDMRVVVSNGTYRFHLAPLAAELARKGILSALITGAYPKGAFLQMLQGSWDARIRRLLDRREDLPDAMVRTCDASEAMFKAGDILFGRHSQQAQQWLHRLAFSKYARSAARHLRGLEYDIYHYRNCFGGLSADLARRSGRKTLCDHSIGHPYAVSLIRRGIDRLVPGSISPQPLNILEAQYLEDFRHADHYLVNSNFVKRTFVASGIEAEKVSVVYWGVDARFLEASDRALATVMDRRPATDLLFCGGFGERKGALDLMDALEMLQRHPWTLTVAGGIEPEALSRWDGFCRRHAARVRYLGFLDRESLAQTMAQFTNFVFPSRMEGSARVVFEALASACHVVTTSHAGSIVEDGVQGRLCEPGSAASLAKVLEETFESGAGPVDIGRRNAEQVRDAYRQDQYASRVVKVYEQLLSA
jgi:glycosyltransferase involved in cell wall biosynthesis